MQSARQRPEIIAVGGGKGGVGKSVFALSLALVLAERGSSVVLADMDLGAANLHTYLGIHVSTPTLADFILKRKTSIEEVLTATSVRNVRLLSGAEFVPGMANPPHAAKVKLMRHLKALPADYLVLDLGAGVHFNTLDFFSMADKGVVLTAPEPGAILNAYGFIKGVLFRRLQQVFRAYPLISEEIDETIEKGRGDAFSLDWLSERLKDVSPELLPLVEEVEKSLSPMLVINKVPDGQVSLLVRNLISLCAEKLGLILEHAGNLPPVDTISHYLINMPKFAQTREGMAYFGAVKKIALALDGGKEIGSRSGKGLKADFSDEDVEEIINLIEGLDEKVFAGSNRDLWKMRMFFKPSEVAGFLMSRGVSHEKFYV